ncbi:MAG TPA: type I methionyl aminopeptidase [Bacteroidales bacterium]|nr:type I methionyl aminopeptidase [Bacteroidales bacterium]
MIYFKTTEEIELLRASNLLVSKALAEVAKHIAPGVTTLFLDRIAEEYIRDNGAVPGFLGYKGYPKTLCTSVNQQVVHGIPSSCVLKDGDIVSVDCGVLFQGYYGDSAYTFTVGEVTQRVKLLLKTTREALYKGIEKVREGNRIGDIGNAVQEHCEREKFSVVREMVGHGIGKGLHEAPEVPNYGKRGHGTKLQQGMVICIEPMINMGRKEIVQDPDGWTIHTVDKMPSAHYEHCVAIGKDKADILSTFEFIEEVYKN